MNINKLYVILKIPILGRIVGFEELGNTDGFTTSVLERRLGQSGRTTYLCLADVETTICISILILVNVSDSWSQIH